MLALPVLATAAAAAAGPTAASSPAPAPAPFRLRKFPASGDGGARCLDGSPAGAYVRVQDPSKWVVWLQGGGECRAEDDCTDRNASSLGSSAGWAATATEGELTGLGSSILHGAAAANPDFHAWSHAFLPYCSGDDWLGTGTDAVRPWGQGAFHAEGHRVLAAAVASLKGDGLGTAARAVLTGWSAGGQGALYHADWFPAQLPAATVHVLAQSSWFGISFPNYTEYAAGGATPGDYPTLPEWLRRVPSFVHAGCAEKEADPAQCGVVPTLYPHIAAPVFVSMNVYDTWTLQTQGGAPIAGFGPMSSIILGNPTLKGYVEMVGATMRGSLQRGVVDGRRESGGLFAPACASHQLGWASGGSVGGRTHSRTVADWVFGRSSKTVLLSSSANLTVVLTGGCDGGVP